MIGAALTDVASALTYFQAIVLGVLQGVTELFPISSLGHTVLFPTLFGWNELVDAQSQSESFWLAFVVMLHVGSALGLLYFYRRDWVEIVGAFFHTLSTRRAETPTRAAGLADHHREHPRGDPRPGLRAPAAHAHRQARGRGDLPDGQRLRAVRGRAVPPPRARCANWRSARAPSPTAGANSTRSSTARRSSSARPSRPRWSPGISRDGVTMGAGLARGMDHSDSARFAFLLATPIILAAGLFKLPDLLGHLGNGIRGQALVGVRVRGGDGRLHGPLPGPLLQDQNADPVRRSTASLFGGAMVIYTQT